MVLAGTWQNHTWCYCNISSDLLSGSLHIRRRRTTEDAKRFGEKCRLYLLTPAPSASRVRPAHILGGLVDFWFGSQQEGQIPKTVRYCEAKSSVSWRLDESYLLAMHRQFRAALRQACFETGAPTRRGPAVALRAGAVGLVCASQQRLRTNWPTRRVATRAIEPFHSSWSSTTTARLTSAGHAARPNLCCHGERRCETIFSWILVGLDGVQTPLLRLQHKNARGKVSKSRNRASRTGAKLARTR